MNRIITAALIAVGLAVAPVATAAPYDPSGCIANPYLPCGSDGNPLAPYWRDSPNGPLVDPACAQWNTCVPGMIVP